MVIKIGINGFGRIGRIVFRTCFSKCNIEITAINDPTITMEYICYLLKFDSIHGKLHEVITYSGDDIMIKDMKIKVFHEKLPSSIPWYSVDVHYVIETSGMFTTVEKASGHLFSKCVKSVIVTAPSVDIPMIILGVNEEDLTKEQRVVSCASSTLYCLAPIVKLLESNFGIAEAFVTCIHALTPSLKPLDGLCLRGKRWRDHRGIHQNIIPAATGACKALTKIIPQVKDKICGLAFRVPTIDVSILDITVRLNKDTNLQRIAKSIEKARTTMKNIIDTSFDETVSSDFMTETHSCILDMRSSLELTSRSFKLVCWYENEYSFACRVMDTILFLEQFKCYETFAATETRSSQSVPSTCKSRNILHTINYHQNCVTCHKQLGPKKQLNNIEIKDSIQHNGIRAVRSSNENTVNRLYDDLQNSKVCTSDKECQTDRKYIKKAGKLLLSRLDQISDEVRNKIKSKADNVLKETNEEVIQRDKRHEDVKFKDCENINYTPNTHDKKINKGVTHIRNISLVNASLAENDVSLINASSAKNDVSLIKSSLADNDVASIKASSAENDVSVINASLAEHDIAVINASLTKKYINQETSHREVINEIGSMPSTFDQHGTELTESFRHNELLSNNDSIVFDDTIGNTSVHNFGGTVIATINNANTCRCRLDVINFVSNCDKRICDSAIIDENKKQEITRQIIRKSKISSATKKSSKDIMLSMFRKVSDSFKVTNESIAKKDLYDKLDSGTDSDTSLQMFETKSQVIDLTDLTNSTEDLARLDKICRIIEISDELSDKLFSVLEQKGLDMSKKKWSFKDLCERIQLDDFCNKVFGPSL